MVIIFSSCKFSHLFKGTVHRHSPHRGFFEAPFFTRAILVASTSYIQVSCCFFHIERAYCVSFLSTIKNNFLSQSFLCKILALFAAKNKKKNCRQKF